MLRMSLNFANWTVQVLGPQMVCASCLHVQIAPAQQSHQALWPKAAPRYVCEGKTSSVEPAHLCNLWAWALVVHCLGTRARAWTRTWSLQCYLACLYLALAPCGPNTGKLHRLPHQSHQQAMLPGSMSHWLAQGVGQHQYILLHWAAVHSQGHVMLSGYVRKGER